MPNDKLHLATRRTDTKPDHHLWNNHGTWWCHFNLCSAAGGSKRHRISLKTHDIATACAKHDRVLHAIQTAYGRIAA